MQRALADLFGEMAESLRLRKNAEKHDPDVLRVGEKLLGSAVADTDDTDDDLRIRAAAPAAFKVTYPRFEPWAGEDLRDLLSKMRNRLHECASQKPVLVYDIDEAMEFCKQMREALINGKPLK